MTEYACPLRQIHYLRDEDTGRVVDYRTDDCGATLHLVWRHDWPIDPEHMIPIAGSEIAGIAYTDSWEVVCENGHTLAVSTFTTEDNERADEFDPIAIVTEMLRAPIGDGSDSPAADVFRGQR